MSFFGVLQLAVIEAIRMFQNTCCRLVTSLSGTSMGLVMTFA